MEAWNRRLWCSDQRSYTRYNVRGLPILNVATEFWPYIQKYDAKILDTLGLGGCGLYGKEEGLSQAEANFKMDVLRRENKVVLNFEMKGVINKPIQMVGECVYIVQISPEEVSKSNFDDESIREEDGVIWYYGIEFLKSHQIYIQPIIERLRHLEERGYVEIFV
ncbi:MAG: hypothetical protein JWQ35_1400 [Bacteriovoracaceae bacterium]|nr:hypothetical protein [Bacteriovoracaceae bacterium]